MSARRKVWRTGASGCWWAIVHRAPDATEPYPWMMGHTRAIAWRKALEHLGYHFNRVHFKCVRVFLVEAQ